MSSHSINFRIYYEDTDAAGIVYYANYLKFAERARTELIRAKNINQHELMTIENLGFVVSHVEASYKKPAKLDDLITVNTTISEIGKVRIKMQQNILLNDVLLVDIKVTLALTNVSTGKPCRISENLKQQLKPIIAK